MKTYIAILFFIGSLMPIFSAPLFSRLNSDPDVIYLQEYLDRPVILEIIKEAPIYATKEGRRQLGTVMINQKVELQAITDRAYKVSANTHKNKVSGWVAPWAFQSKDPNFVENLAKLYERQMLVNQYIQEGHVAIGMTMDEVAQILGNPTKTQMRRTKDGESGKWEYIEYKEIQHYNYIRHPITGQVFRQPSYVEREERFKTLVEFENDLVSAVEESESNSRKNRPRIVIPPIIFHW